MKFYLFFTALKKVIGKTLDKNIGKVGLQTAIGGVRLIDLLGEDQVPRIC